MNWKRTLFNPSNWFSRSAVQIVEPPMLSGKQSASVPPALARILRPESVSRWLLPSVANITPQYIESILRGAMAGSHVQQWELFDLMEDTWPRLAKNLLEIKRCVRGMDWRLKAWAEEDMPPSTNAEERERLVSNAIWGMRPRADWDENDFDGTIFDILDSWAKGTSVLEIDWSIRNAGSLGRITAPVCTTWVHPSKYAWSEEGWLGLVQSSMSGASQQINSRSTSLVPFPPNKFLIAIAKAKTGHPLSAALLRSLAWWWCAANFSADWLLNLAQVFGLPFRWANYSTNASASTVTAICSMLENMGSAGWAAFPEGTKLELKEASKSGDASPQADLLDRSDRQCDILILGQTLTTDVGTSGSLALGNVHQSVRDDVIAAAADFAAQVINRQLIPAILRLNYGNDEDAPEICPEQKGIEDSKANAERDNILLQAGVELPKDWFFKRHGVPLPKEGEEVVKGRAPQPAPGTLPVTAAKPEPTPAPVKAAKTSAAEVSAVAVQQLGSARAEDLRIVQQQIQRIMEIADPELRKQKLAEFRQALPQTLKDINAFPAQTAVIYDRLTEALLKGFTQKENQP